MHTSHFVAPDEAFLAEVRLAWNERREQQRKALVLRREQARDVATAMARHLKSKYGATRVVLFGTTVTGSFHGRSDIDIAAWGIRDDDWLNAYGDIAWFDKDFEGDLVLMERCRPHIAEEIVRTGMDL